MKKMEAVETESIAMVTDMTAVKKKPRVTVAKTRTRPQILMEQAAALTRVTLIAGQVQTQKIVETMVAVMRMAVAMLNKVLINLTRTETKIIRNRNIPRKQLLRANCLRKLPIF
jgi:hypothetical protein